MVRLLETVDGQTLRLFIVEPEDTSEHVLRDALDSSTLLRDGLDGATIAFVGASGLLATLGSLAALVSSSTFSTISP